MPKMPNLSSQMKIAIWNQAALLGNRDLVGIQRSLDHLSDNGELSEDVPGTEKIKDVIAELQTMRIAVLRTLPDHIWTLRDDYEEIKASLQEGQRYQDSARTGPAGKGQRKPESLEDRGGNDRALQIEYSVHWKGMRRTAERLRRQLCAPLQRLLGLYVSDTPNPDLTLEFQGQDNPVRLQVEREPLFIALQEHLPESPVWDIVERWKQQVIDIHDQLPGLCQWVTDQPELRNLPYIPSGQPVWSQSGLTEFFAKIIVETAAEDVYRDRAVDDFLRHSMELEYKPRSLKPNSDGQALDWALGRNSFTIVVNEDIGELERFKGLHMKLRVAIRTIPELQALVAAFKELHRLEGAAAQELLRIENRAVFPGKCALCSS